MCEAVVLCEAGERRDAEERISDRGSFSLYHLQTRTFWSQIATIWAWFITNFDAGSLAVGGHTRPVHVYEVADGHWSDMRVVTARLTLEPATIDLGDRTIDRDASRQLRGFLSREPCDTTICASGMGRHDRRTHRRDRPADRPDYTAGSMVKPLYPDKSCDRRILRCVADPVFHPERGVPDLADRIMVWSGSTAGSAFPGIKMVRLTPAKNPN
jgi:hypothetical protein